MYPEPEKPWSVSGLIGKYICFFAFAILLWMVPLLVMAVWKWANGAADRHLQEIVIYLAGIVGAAICAFLVGLSLAFRRPFVAVCLFIAGWVVVAWTFPDR